MSFRFNLWLLLSAISLGCNGQTGSTTSTTSTTVSSTTGQSTTATESPIVSISSPVESTPYYADHLVLFEGIVTAPTNASTPTVWWESDIDGIVKLDLEQKGTLYYAYGYLSAGDHTLTMQAESDGAQGSDSIEVSVNEYNTPPDCAITSPTEGEVFLAGAPVMLAGTATDSDLSADLLLIEWASDIEGIVDTTAASVDGTLAATVSVLSVGAHTLTLSVTDEIADSCVVTVSIEVEANSPPNAPAISIGPDPARTADDLLASIDKPSTDPEGSKVTYTYDWYQNGTLSVAAGTNTITSANTEGGDTWMVVVTPNDGIEDGTSGAASITISNTVPMATDVSISPDPAYRNDTLSCTYTFSDTDADTDLSLLSWTVDGVTAGTSPTLSGLFDATQTVACTVTPFDGSDYGTATSASVVIENRAPELDAVVLTPDPASTSDTFTCTPGTTTDEDGDTSFSYSYEWRAGGADVGVSTTTLSNAYFSSGDTVRCKITPSDGHDSGATVTSNAVTVDNTPPSISAVAIAPNPATSSDELSCSWSGFTDLDGDTDQSTLVWEINGTAVSTASSLASGFVGGDTVTCTVTPYDGVDTGTALNTSIIIDSAAPVLDDATLTPEPAYESDTFSCVAGAITDLDSSPPFGKTYGWTVNSSSIGATTATLASTEWSYDDTVQCFITPDDGANYGDTVASNSVTVSNSSPSITNISITPSTPGADETITCSATGFTDADGHADQTTYSWRVNGAFVSAGVTLSGEFSIGDTVECSATANDGIDDGNTLSTSVSVSNTPPEVTSVSITPNPAYDESITCNVDSVVDPDEGQTITYSTKWYINGSTSAITNTTLTASNFIKGDTVYCAMRPNDGIASGSYTSSPEVVIQNSAPTINNAWLNPSTPGPSDEVECNYNFYDDLDGDADQTTFEWTVAGVVVSTASTISGVFEAGDFIECTVTPYDGEDYGTPMVASGSVTNSLPIIFSMNVSPATIYTNDIVTVDVVAGDDDGHTVSFDYEWLVNGAVVSTDTTLDGSLYFDKADDISVRVTPFDGYEFGSSNTSSERTVRNTQPSAPTIAITPSEPYGGIDSIQCEVLTAATDDDGDAITYDILWKEDGSYYGGTTVTTTLPDDTIEPVKLNEGEEWSCTVNANDGSTDSDDAIDSVTVLDPCLILGCDTADTGGSGVPGPYDDTWATNFYGEFSAPALGISDTCDVIFDVVIEEGAAPEMRGSTECVLHYTFMGYDITDTKGVLLSANMTSDPNFEGELTVDTTIEAWSGEFLDANHFYGEFSGSMEVYGYIVKYSGYIDGTR